MGINIAFYFNREDKREFQVPFHTHQCHEMVYYYSGRGHCDIADERFSFEDGSYVIIPPGREHNDIHGTDCAMACLGFTIDPEGLQPLQGSHMDTNRMIWKYLSMIDGEFQAKSPEFITVINNLLEVIIIENLRRQPEHLIKAPHGESILAAVNYINEYYLTDITLHHLAGMTGYSYHHFRHLFTRVLGTPPMKYIITKRLEHAKKLLATTSDTVTDIAQQCLFPSVSLFIQQFKHANGLTPARYREQVHSSLIFSSGQSTYKKDKPGLPEL